MGQPREVHDLPDGGRSLMWPMQPMGATNVVAVVDASGKIVSVRQVLHLSESELAQIGKWTSDVASSLFRHPTHSFLRWPPLRPVERSAQTIERW
ncbi:hypothetical protein [Paraburkholderia sp. J10-1]|uniref:hypothetical protein n=1 Tax=Paraburkholderia sp. J10-1 TaxID=2805430 RepID=UPI0039EF61FC